MKADLSKKVKEGLSIIEQWEDICQDILDLHKDIRSRFWLSIQIEGPDSELANPLWFNVIRITETVDREAKVLLRQGSLIRKACEQGNVDSAQILSMIEAFFKTRKKYSKRWEIFDEQITYLSDIIPDDDELGLDLEDFPEF